MNARDFLALALHLAQESAESEWRSAVSRAYYAAFHVARELLQQCGFLVPRSERAHAYLWLRLANSGHLATATAGSKLNTLNGDRNRADYDLYTVLSCHLWLRLRFK